MITITQTQFYSSLYNTNKIVKIIVVINKKYCIMYIMLTRTLKQTTKMFKIIVDINTKYCIMYILSNNNIGD